MTHADCSPDEPVPAELERPAPGDDPVRDNCVTWLLNDLRSVDSGADIFAGGADRDESVETALARAVDAVDLPEDVLILAQLVPPPGPPFPPQPENPTAGREGY